MKNKKYKYKEILRWAYDKQGAPFTEKELFTKFNTTNDPDFRDWYVMTFRGGQNSNDCMFGLGQSVDNTYYIHLTTKGLSAALALNKKPQEKITRHENYLKKIKNNPVLAILIIVVVAITAILTLINQFSEAFSNIKGTPASSVQPNKETTNRKLDIVSNAALSGSIAFLKTVNKKNQIFIVRAFYGAQESSSTRFSHDDNDYSAIDWSPDGRYLAACDFNKGLFILNQKGLIERQFDKANCINVAWSPLGKYLAFEFDGQIFTINNDGTGIRNITGMPTTYYEPTWLDEENIIFSEFTSTLLKANINKTTMAEPYLTTRSGFPTEPYKGARNDLLVFTVCENNFQFCDIYIKNILTNKQWPIATSPTANERFPKISPDGRHVAYIHKEKNKMEIQIKTSGGEYPETSGLRVPDSNEVVAASLSWFPD